MQQVLEPLVWSRRCCHVLVEDPWSYWGGDECGCESAQHHKRHELRDALKRWGHVAHLDRHIRPKV
ncbi:hypothetical protein [Nocardioides dokdonensis]|uniref:hypothetical protein n=1 Tax=Nocardioides dokdonensis TaxID=450734 RepID=UPI0012FC01D5|nr:hypothetical protein [Nocardioides dokdonensis]